MKRGLLSFIAASGIAIAGCGKTDRMMVSGNVMIDKKPVDRGLITIESVDNSDKPTGASITNGKFAIDQSHGLRPGDHRVILQAQRRTGKKIRDRQMPKEVDEMVIVNLKTDTLTAPVSVDNAQHLEFNFNEAR
jgi:hypothetical protein